ncbi:MAG: ParB/RepB/Spo0J family partition protein [Firmicutes bacterium]|nr:ParB/RepB/Spo0J family partition protein [Bacillota bacterium]
MAAKKGGLGRGLGALIKEDPVAVVSNDDQSKVFSVDINKITPNKSQPRKKFDEESLEELAESIKGIGVIQPITVKKNEDHYVIIAGERRWRAARKAGITEIPVIVRDDISDLEALEIALIENIQREDLNPLEEALTYKKFAEEFNLNQEAIAEKVGKSRAAVANSIRLLNLDKRVQTFLVENRLSSGHCRALLGLPNNDEQFETAELIIEEGLSVRQTEELIKAKNEAVPEEVKKPSIKNPEEARIYISLMKDLKSILGTKVNIKPKKNKKGRIEIEYYSDEDLDRIVTMIRQIH